jgi:hypothetical protein
MVRQKYLSTNEMVTGFEKKTNLPIQQSASRPGDVRIIFRPTKYDVLCGRGAPIQNHEGNIRMRRIVAKYARRYMQSRKYRKQMIAEEAVRRVKSSEIETETGTGSKVKARFLRRVGRENYWEEVDDRITCDKVAHALRCFVRKMEDGGNVSEEDGNTSLADDEPDAPASSSSVLTSTQETLGASPSGASPTVAPNLLEESAAAMRALQTSMLGPKLIPIRTMPLIPGHPALHSSSFATTGVSIAPPLSGASAAARNTPIIATEAELDYRRSLQALSTRRLMDLIAVERAQQRFRLVPTDAMATSFATTALASARMEMEQSSLLHHQHLLTLARMRELMEKDPISLGSKTLTDTTSTGA